MACKYRPRAPVLAITPSPEVASYLLMTRGAIPLVVQSMKGSDQLISYAMEWAKKEGITKTGGICVVISGLIEQQPGNSNNMRVIAVP